MIALPNSSAKKRWENPRQYKSATRLKSTVRNTRQHCRTVHKPQAMWKLRGDPVAGGSGEIIDATITAGEADLITKRPKSRKALGRLTRNKISSISNCNHKIQYKCPRPS